MLKFDVSYSTIMSMIARSYTGFNLLFKII